jgi:hypothetical protein
VALVIRIPKMLAPGSDAPIFRLPAALRRACSHNWSGDNDRIKLHGFPPRLFVAAAVEKTMVGAAKRNRELVAHPSAKRTRLCKSQMMGVRRLASAQQAWLRSALNPSS